MLLVSDTRVKSSRWSRRRSAKVGWSSPGRAFTLAVRPNRTAQRRGLHVHAYPIHRAPDSEPGSACVCAGGPKELASHAFSLPHFLIPASLSRAPNTFLQSSKLASTTKLSLFLLPPAPIYTRAPATKRTHYQSAAARVSSRQSTNRNLPIENPRRSEIEEDGDGGV